MGFSGSYLCYCCPDNSVPVCCQWKFVKIMCSCPCCFVFNCSSHSSKPTDDELRRSLQVHQIGWKACYVQDLRLIHSFQRKTLTHRHTHMPCENRWPAFQRFAVVLGSWQQIIRSLAALLFLLRTASVMHFVSQADQCLDSRPSICSC